jgi:hypothetical protein
MPTSEARILANRANSLKSTGPSPEGRRISARNSLKHGMAGRGVVLPDSDAAEVERRNQALQAELAPATEMGVVLVHRLAMLSVRMEKGARHASARRPGASATPERTSTRAGSTGPRTSWRGSPRTPDARSASSGGCPRGSTCWSPSGATSAPT